MDFQYWLRLGKLGRCRLTLRHEDGDRFGIHVSVINDDGRKGFTRYATHTKACDLDRELHRLIQFELQTQAANAAVAEQARARSKSRERIR